MHPSPTSTVPDRLLVVLPAHNEEETVARVVRSARARSNGDVVVVDDASTDATVAAARDAGAIVLPLSLQLNAWGATQAGLRFAVKNGYTLVVTMDADGQHEAESIADLLAPIIAGRADVVIGACPERGSRARKLAWTFFRRITGLSLEDLTSGLRAYNLAAITALATREATLLEYQDLGVLLLLRHSGLIIAEVPVVMCLRETGKSRIFSSWSRVFLYMLHTGILCLAKVHSSNTPPAPRDSRRGRLT